MRPCERSFVDMDAAPESAKAEGTWLRLCASFVDGRSEGEDGRREKLGRGWLVTVAWLERLPVDVADRNEGGVVEPKPAKLANAVEVRSLASDARERRLLL